MSLSAQDKSEIQEINTAFAILLDERRFSDVAALFSEDGILKRVDGSVVRGRADIQAAQASRHESVDTVHHASALLIEAVGPDEARGRASLIAVSVDRSDGDTKGWVIGYFADRYRRDSDGWRIAERSIHLVHRR